MALQMRLIVINQADKASALMRQRTLREHKFHRLQAFFCFCFCFFLFYLHTSQSLTGIDKVTRDSTYFSLQQIPEETHTGYLPEFVVTAEYGSSLC